MIQINAVGLACPLPVIKVSKALEKGYQHIEIIVDNIIAVQNLIKLAESKRLFIEFEEDEKQLFTVNIIRDNKQEEEMQVKKSEEKNISVFISSNCLGKGEEDLGKILMKSFIYSLKELQKPPKRIIFMNSGALLSSKHSNTLSDLLELQNKGTQIYTCGTCTDYYQITEQLAVGEIIDMYTITNFLTSSEEKWLQIS